MYETVTTLKRLHSLVADLETSKRFAIDTETTSTDPMSCKLVGVSLSLEPDSGFYIPVGHTTGEPQLPLDVVLTALAPVLANPKIAKTGHNLMYDIVVLRRYGVELVNIDDTMLMSYALEGKTFKHWHGMDDLAPIHLDRHTIEFDEVVIAELGMTGFQDVSHYHATLYAAEDADITLDLFYELRAKLKDAGLWHVYADIDRPALPALADMKFNGIAVSTKAFRKLEEQWTAEKEDTEDAIMQMADEAGSVIKLTNAGIAKFLFDDLKLDALKQTDSGGDSVDAEALEAIEDDHPIVPLILKWNKLSKLLSTYATPLQKVHPETRRIHTDLKACFTNTGRLSSANPNLQNIPTANNAKHAKQGELIRSCFVAPRGHKLICADYSQIELRVLAHISKDKTLVRAFLEGKDPHGATATALFNVTDKEVSPVEWGGFRRKAKTINFGIVYGITQFGLSKQLKCDPDEAQDFIDRYFAELPGVEQYIESQKEMVRAEGYTETLWGRRMYQPGIRGHKGAVGHAERAAVNAPIQGSAADIVRKAMAKTRTALIEEGLPADMLLQVHDELIFEVPDEYVPEAEKVIKHAMQTAGDDIDWLVPILVDVKHGETWHHAH